ncbi:MAG: hypothetical protein WAO91_08385 [Candidatus Nitrosotenuis sp.]
MSYNDELDKDRLYFTQCNDEFPLRCPECTESKILRHCKIFTNFPGAWRHIKRVHNDIPPSKMDEIKQILSSIYKAYQWKMFPNWKYVGRKSNATSSSLRFDGRSITRADVLSNVQEIARVLQNQSELYPNFNPKQLSAFIKVAIGEVDSRTAKKYLNCVIDASSIDKVRGIIDVRAFCDTAGV